MYNFRCFNPRLDMVRTIYLQHLTQIKDSIPTFSLFRAVLFKAMFQFCDCSNFFQFLDIKFEWKSQVLHAVENNRLKLHCTVLVVNCPSDYFGFFHSCQSLWNETGYLRATFKYGVTICRFNSLDTMHVVMKLRIIVSVSQCLEHGCVW